MKNMRKFLLIGMIIAMILPACRPDKAAAIGDTRDVVASFAGSWKLTSVIQKDEDAARKGFPYSTLDLTTVFPYSDFKLTLNQANNGSLYSFTTTPGNSPAVIKLTSGNWSVDDGTAPTAITFTQGTSTQTVTLGAYPIGNNGNLSFNIQKKDATSGKLLVSYTYTFSKQ